MLLDWLAIFTVGSLLAGLAYQVIVLQEQLATERCAKRAIASELTYKTALIAALLKRL